MRTLRQVSIKNCLHYFFDDMTNIKNFDPNLLSIGQMSFKKDTDCIIYDTDYFKNLNSKNSFYVVFNNVDAYIEENDEGKYLIFTLPDKKKEALENHTELWDEIKDQIETKSGNKPIEYKKYLIKIKFESADDLPLIKMLNIPECVIIVRSVFQENSKYYPQVFYMIVFMNMNMKMVLMLLYK